MPESILVAETDEQYQEFAALIREYLGWLQTRYAEVPGFVDEVGNHQALDDELLALPTKYGPPAGKTLLAVRDGQTLGCVSYRDLGDGSCEMKRLFVPERFQGHGTGRRLCEALVAEATSDGYRLMRLDSGFLQDEALGMYESMGFRFCEPYHRYPEHLMLYLRFMERPLGPPGEDGTTGRR